MASPCAPPLQIAARPRPPPRRRNSCDQGGDEARAACTDGVAEGDSPAVDIDARQVGVAEAEAARGDDCDVSEGFVDLEEVNVGDCQPGLVQCPLRG